MGKKERKDRGDGGDSPHSKKQRREDKEQARSRHHHQQQQHDEGPPAAAAPGSTSAQAADSTGAEAVPKRVTIQVVNPTEGQMRGVAAYFPAGQPPQGGTYTVYASGSTLEPNYTVVADKVGN
jgi:hypothetical protein